MHFLLALLALLSPQSALCDGYIGDGLYRVRSEFRDEETHKDHTFAGTGALAEIHGRYFIITSAHVSQGAAMRIELGEGREAKVVGRLADSFNDVELIEVENPGVPELLHYKDDCRCLVADQETLKAYRFPLERTALQKMVADLPRDGLLYMGSDYRNFVLIPPWMNQPRNQYNYRKGSTPESQGTGIYETGYREEIFAAGKIVPGQSGGPLLQKIGNEVRLAGVSKRYFNDFKGSFFSHEKVVSGLIQSYEEGKRGGLDSTKHRFRRGLLFRDFGQGTLEVNVTTRPAGGSISSDGGGSISSDGGSNSRCASLPGDVYKNCGIEPGMLWKGSPVLGFTISGKSPVTANYSALGVARQNREWEKTLVPVKPGDDLSRLLRERLQVDANSDKLLHSDFYPESPNLEEEQALWTDKKVLLGKDGHLNVSIAISRRIKSVFGWRVETERLSFELDEKGALPGASYRPVITLKSNFGHEFLIHLDSLYFADLAKQESPELQKPELRIRRKDRSYEYRMAFLTARPIITKATGAAESFGQSAR